MEVESIVCWQDGSEREILWFQHASRQSAERWFDKPDQDGAGGGFIETPGPDVVIVERLDTLELTMAEPRLEVLGDDPVDRTVADLATATLGNHRLAGETHLEESRRLSPVAGRKAVTWLR